MQPHVEYLASWDLEGRGTEKGKALACEYLAGQFRRMNLQPLFAGASFLQDIPGPRARPGDSHVLGRNVGAWLPGRDPKLRDEYIIVSAHYDHLGIQNGKLYPGADDNAGSVAMLLEVARQLSYARPGLRRSVVFLSCDLEEQLLWGARWFVAHPPWPLEKVKLFITAEMIGRSLGDLPMEEVFLLGTEHGTGLTATAKQAAARCGLPLAHLGVDLIGTRSDYGPFQAEKIPFAFFSCGEHPDYHAPTDLPERMNFDQVARVSNTILELTRRVADADDAPVWTGTPARDLEEVRTLHHITSVLLKTDAAARGTDRPRLTELQRFTVSNVHTRAAQIIERGTVVPEERPWLVRSAQLLLLTVF